MRAPILITLLALFAISCASRRDVASVKQEGHYDQSYQHAQLIDGANVRIR